MPPKKKIADKTDKRLRQKVVVGHDIDGKPIIKYASGKTKKELAQNVDELKKRYIGGIEAQRDIPFGVFAAQWFEVYKKPKLKPGSIALYLSILNTHLFPAFEDRQLKAITTMDLQKLLNSKSTLTKGTIDNIVMVTKQIFRSALAQNFIDRDPVIALTRHGVELQPRRALTDAETTALLEVARESKDGLLILLLYYTGARLGEVLGLKWSDVDFANKTINIERTIDGTTHKEGTPKTKSSVRTVPIPAPLYTALVSERGIGYILKGPKGGHLNHRTAHRRWDYLMKAVYQKDSSIESEYMNNTTARKSILTPHYLRHNYASLLYNAGVDVLSAQKWLGHSSAKTTLEIYSHLSAGKERSDAAKLDSVFK